MSTRAWSMTSNVFGSPNVQVVRAGDWVAANGASLSTGAPALNVMHMALFRFPVGTRLDRIGIEHTAVGGAGSVMRLGVFSDLNGRPTDLLVDAGTVDGTVAAAFQELVINVVTTTPLVWCSYVAQVGTVPTIRLASNPGLPPTFTAPTTATNVAGLTVNGVTGALSSNPAIAASTSSVARVQVRVA